MAQPSNVALYGFLSQAWVLNTTSGSQAVIDRVQSVDMSDAITTQKYYELGTKGPTGATQNPAQYRVALMQNLYNSLELDYILSGKNISPAGVQTWNLGDLLTYAGKYTCYVLNRNQDNTIMDEKEINGCSIADITWSFAINKAIDQTFNFIGTGGKLYKGPSNTIHTWGVADTASLGGIHGKEARIWFTSGSVATTRSYRLQTLTLKATFPAVYVGELGNRQLVGTLSDSPDVTLDFDLLIADDQPTEKFFADQSTYYDLGQTNTPFDAWIRIDDPTQTEGVAIVKAFHLENVLAVAHTPVRTQVRGLSTARYSLIGSKETTVGSGGLIISNGNL